MSLAWFSKGKGKEKDREANGHRFSAGACLGSVVCMVCDKQASGKELLHCAGELGRRSSSGTQLRVFIKGQRRTNSQAFDFLHVR